MPPLSWGRVEKAMRLGLPRGLFGNPDAAGLKEVRVHSRVLARVRDLVDAFLPELLLESSCDWFLSRWEAILELPVRPLDSIPERVARVRGRLSRRGGLTRRRLSYVLAPLLNVQESDLQWLEVTRALIDPGMTAELPIPGPVTVAVASSYCWRIDTPWPSFVDDTGVRLEVDVGLNPTSNIRIRVKHVSGASWTALDYNAHVNQGDLTAGFENRSRFANLGAAGPWEVWLDCALGGDTATIRAMSLRVSNDADASMIYVGFVLRPLTLGVTTPVNAAQAELERAGLGHVEAHVIERNQFLCDDLHSLCGREPLGPLT